MTTVSWATPGSLEVWFLSAPKKTSYIEKILKEVTRTSPQYALNLKCQPMGDYCFDPQYGLYKPDDMEEEVKTEEATKEMKGPVIPTAHSVDRELIDCDKTNHFDMFCGKAKPEAAKSPSTMEIWIDTSSSMREMDYTDKDGSCFRKSLVKRLDTEGCGFNKNLNVMMFDTSIKQAGVMDSLCLNIGLNDYKKVIDWIERSNAKKLIIVTDLYELHKDFADYIESRGGVIRGDKEPMLSAKDMLDHVDRLAKSCK